MHRPVDYLKETEFFREKSAFFEWKGIFFLIKREICEWKLNFLTKNGFYQGKKKDFSSKQMEKSSNYKQWTICFIEHILSFSLSLFLTVNEKNWWKKAEPLLTLSNIQWTLNMLIKHHLIFTVLVSHGKIKHDSMCVWVCVCVCVWSMSVYSGGRFIVRKTHISHLKPAWSNIHKFKQ